MEKSNEPIIEGINGYLADHAFYALWKYANSDRLIPKSLCNFEDLAGLESNRLVSSLTITRFLKEIKLSLEGLVFLTGLYEKMAKASYQMLISDIEDHSERGVTPSLKKLLAGQPLTYEELEDILISGNRYNLHEWFVFDKPKGHAKKELDLYVNNYLDLFIHNQLLKEKENYFQFAKQKEITLSKIKNHHDNYGSSFIFYYPETIPQFSAEPEYLPIHSFASLEKLGFLGIEAIWIFDMDVPPEEQTEQYKMKLTIQPMLEEVFQTFHSRTHAVPFMEVPVKKAPTEKTYFNEKQSILHIFGKDILISSSQNSDLHDLLVTIFKDPRRAWNNDEILDDWKFDADPTKVPKNKVYHAGMAVNRKIAENTMTKDFLEVTTKLVRINEKYLGSLGTK